MSQDRINHFDNKHQLNGMWQDIYSRKKQSYQALEAGVLCKIGYPSETHLKLKSREISSITSVSIVQSVWNFAQSTAVTLSCSVQNFKAISQLHELWANEISRDLSLRWISDGYPILHKAPGLRLLAQERPGRRRKAIRKARISADTLRATF